MKNGNGGSRGPRREQILDDPRHDSYKSKGKLADPTRCPKCGVTYHKGRWTWESAAGDAHEQLCPACHRIQDRFPAGYVTLSGEFLKAHREEILALAKNCEDKEKAQHPMQRIMAIQDTKDGVLVTTTDSHLARNIAQRVHNAHKGDLALDYGKDDNVLRATWKR